MAFLNEAGLAHFYEALEGKFVKQGDSSAGNASKVCVGEYTGQVGAGASWDDITYGWFNRVSVNAPGLPSQFQIDKIVIASSKSTTFLFPFTNASADTFTASGMSVFKSDDETVGVGFLSDVVINVKDVSQQGKITISYGSKPLGFVPYDAAFTSLVPDFESAISNESGVSYRTTIYYHEEVSA